MHSTDVDLVHDVDEHGQGEAIAWVVLAGVWVGFMATAGVWIGRAVYGIARDPLARQVAGWPW